MNAIRIIIILTAAALTACATNNPADPLEPMNRGIYKFNNAVDKAVIKPVARGYKAVVPTVGRIMISNFFSNLDDINVTANDLLQLKLVQGFSDGIRFFVNSTLGVFGLIDVASVGDLKKHHEDFGQTLGYWGVGNGPYLVLPILGPSTLRDGVGDYIDSLDEAMIDPYEFIRDAYLMRRQSQVHDNNSTRPKYDDEDSSDTVPTQPSPTTQSSPATEPPSTTP
jgi:phospholipid-binding lipoprotein MlaA